MKKTIIDILLFILDWTWCLPQILIGRIKSAAWYASLCKAEDASLKVIKDLEKKYRCEIYLVKRESRNEHRFFKKISGSGIGRYICLTETEPDNGAIDDEATVRHEIGHVIQSRILGPFFVLVMICSPLYNLKSRSLEKQGWTWEQLVRWYYSRWCEAWADTLAKVDREKWIEARK